MTWWSAGHDGVGGDDDPVGEHRHGERLDVVGDHVVTLVGRREGPGGPQDMIEARGLAPR